MTVRAVLPVFAMVAWAVAEVPAMRAPKARLPVTEIVAAEETCSARTGATPHRPARTRTAAARRVDPPPSTTPEELLAKSSGTNATARNEDRNHPMG